MDMHTGVVDVTYAYNLGKATGRATNNLRAIKVITSKHTNTKKG